MAEVDWHEVARCTMHPIKVQVIELLDGHVRSPKELAHTIDSPLATVSHHVRQLRDKGAIHLVSTRKVRGGTEHFYALSAEASTRR